MTPDVRPPGDRPGHRVRGRAPASAATIAVSPTTVQTSGTVTVSGDVLVNGTRNCAVGDDVTLISNAFAGFSEFAGQGALVLPVDATGHFTSTVTLKPSVPAGTYTITGRCGGGNLGVSATLTVTGLPRTGASFGPLSVAEVLAIAAGLVGLGVASCGPAAGATRRHRRDDLRSGASAEAEAAALLAHQGLVGGRRRGRRLVPRRPARVRTRRASPSRGCRPTR